MLGGAKVWGPLGYGVGARGTRKARFKGPQSQGQRGLEVWHRGTALVPVPPTEAERGGPLPGSSHRLCSMHVPRSWGLCGARWDGASLSRGPRSAKHGGTPGCTQSASAAAGSAAYHGQQWAKPRCPSPSGGLSFVLGGVLFAVCTVFALRLPGVLLGSTTSCVNRSLRAVLIS